MQGQPGRGGFVRRTFIREESVSATSDERTQRWTIQWETELASSSIRPPFPPCPSILSQFSARNPAPVPDFANPLLPPSLPDQQGAGVRASVQQLRDQSVPAGAGVQRGQRCGLLGLSSGNCSCGYVHNLFGRPKPKWPRLASPTGGGDVSAVVATTVVQLTPITYQASSSSVQPPPSEVPSMSNPGTSDEFAVPNPIERNLSLFPTSSANPTGVTHSWPKPEDKANRQSIKQIWRPISTPNVSISSA